MKCAILLNRSTTTMMASNLFEGGKLTMKSIDTFSHNPSRIGKGCNKPACFLLKLQFIDKLNKSSHTPPHNPLSWANNRTSLGMLWCAWRHHGPQAIHHDIPSKVCPSFSLLAHKVDFACTTIIHFANGSGTWLHFGCFALPPWQKHLGGLLV